MSAKAIRREKAIGVREALGSPVARPRLRLVHDINQPALAHHEPRQRFASRASLALNKATAFAIVVVAFVSVGIGCYVAGWNDRVLTEARARVAEIMAAPLPPPLQPLGEFDRITGKSR